MILLVHFYFVAGTILFVRAECTLGARGFSWTVSSFERPSVEDNKAPCHTREKTSGTQGSAHYVTLKNGSS